MPWKAKPPTLTPPFRSNRSETEPWAIVYKKSGETAEFYTFVNEDEAKMQHAILTRLLKQSE